MEFPDLGNHCSQKSCRKLDFLPLKCDACNQIFCSDHFSYAHHSCHSAHKNDVQVPVCPLCGEPVPTPRGVPPDRTVGEHIDQYCKSQTKKVFTNRCTYKACKKKELLPFQCSQCKRNYCLRHRHFADHECTGPKEKDSQRSLVAKAAELRRARPNQIFTQPPRTNAHHAQTVQGNLSEDEALAKALALSILELDESNDRNRRNQLAAAVQVGETTEGATNTTENKDKCSLS